MATVDPSLATKVKGKERAIIESIDLSEAASTPSLPAPPASTAHQHSAAGPLSEPTRIISLQDFYSVLDKLERTSGMGFMFLEAYAERLRDEVCRDCWLRSNVLSDEDLIEPVKLSSRPAWTKAVYAALGEG